jgi:hypothetical protein
MRARAALSAVMLMPLAACTTPGTSDGPDTPDVSAVPRSTTTAVVPDQEESSPGVVSAHTAPSPAWFRSLRHDLRTFDVRLAPADGARPDVTKREVRARNDWSESNLRGTPPAQILLRRVTAAQYGPTGPDGEVRPIVDERLAWVVVDADAWVCPAPGGPPENPVSCGPGSFTTVIDATSGRFLTTYVLVGAPHARDVADAHRRAG